jgi:hypothetical protein
MPEQPKKRRKPRGFRDLERQLETDPISPVQSKRRYCPACGWVGRPEIVDSVQVCPACDAALPNLEPRKDSLHPEGL